MAAIQYTTLEEAPARSAIVIPFPGARTRAARPGRASGARRPDGAPPVAAPPVGEGRRDSGSCGPGGAAPVAVPPVGGGGGASGACGPGGALPAGAAATAARCLLADGDDRDDYGALPVSAGAAPTAARLPESVYGRRRLVAASLVAAALTVLLAVARPVEAPLEAVDPWSSQVTPLTEGDSVGEGV